MSEHDLVLEAHRVVVAGSGRRVRHLVGVVASVQMQVTAFMGAPRV